MADECYRMLFSQGKDVFHFVYGAEYYFNCIKVGYTCLCYICLMQSRCVFHDVKMCCLCFPCQPKAPDWSNKEQNSQYLGREKIGGAAGRENKWEEKSGVGKKKARRRDFLAHLLKSGLRGVGPPTETVCLN